MGLLLEKLPLQPEFFNTPDNISDKDKPGFAHRTIRWNVGENAYELVSSRNVSDASGTVAENTEDTIIFDDPEVLRLAIQDLRDAGTTTIEAKGKITRVVQQSNHPYGIDDGWWQDDDHTTCESGEIICELKIEDGTLAPFTAIVQPKS